MKQILLTALPLLFCSALYADPEITGTPQELLGYLTSAPKTVVIAGEAELKVPAEEAVLSIKVSTEHKSLQAAIRANQELRSKVLAAWQKEGIPPERVQSSRFSSTPKTGWLGDKVKGYRIENIMKVRVHDEKEMQSATAVLDGSGDLQFIGVEFQHPDKEQWKRKAIAQACENALERRTVFEQKLGLVLKPVSFTDAKAAEGQSAPVIVKGYGGSYYGSSLPERKSPELVAGLPAADDISSFSELVYSAEVKLEFEVRPK